MALEWGKEISFSGLKKKPSKKQGAEYPEKTYMNLMIDDKESFDTRANLPAIIALIVVVALVMKFGIFDLYGKVGAKEAELASHRSTLNALTAQLADYDAVLEEYEGYESMSITTGGLQVDAEKALNLVDRFVAPSARVGSLTLSGNTLALDLAGISLDGVGRLVSTLYELDMVSNVSVSTAATQQAETAAMTITLVPDSE